MSAAQAPVFKMRLERNDSGQPWGFRLQGGADFSTPLSIQKVTPGTVADGKLCAGDAVLQINGANTDVMEHEEAKMAIIRSGNEIIFTLQRGSVSVWQPKVTPLEDIRPNQPVDPNSLPGEPPLMQKTSLAANKQEVLHIGSGHNRAAAPFRPGGASYQPVSVVEGQQSPDQNGSASSWQPSPHQTPAEPSSYQTSAELDFPPPPPDMASPTGGRQGDAVVSQLQSLQLQQPRPAPTQQGEDTGIDYTPQFTPSGHQHDINSSRSMRMLQQSIAQGEGGGVHHAPQQNVSNQRPAGFRSVQAPQVPRGGAQPQQDIPVCQECKGCRKIISVNNRMPNSSGVFMKIKSFYYHPECFKCESCGTNLRHKGYFFIDNQVLCETHARIKTRPPGAGMYAVVTDVPDDYE